MNARDAATFFRRRKSSRPLAAAALSLFSFLSFSLFSLLSFSLFSPRPPSSHHPHQTKKNASRPRERAQSRGRHPLPRVRLPDPLQEADEASRAVRGEVEAERKKKVDATRKRGDTKRESRASAEFCFPLVLSTTTGPLPALIPPRAEREIGSPACLVNVVKMTERKRKIKTWRGRKEEREDQDEDQTHFSLAPSLSLSGRFPLFTL